MEVILLERISTLGQMGETVKVKDGYARNYLLPQGKALRANEANKKKFEAREGAARGAQSGAARARRRRSPRSSTARASWSSARPARPASSTARCRRATSPTLLGADGFTVARSQVGLDRAIKAIGLTKVAIALHPEVEVPITINVARTATRPSARRAARR